MIWYRWMRFMIFVKESNDSMVDRTYYFKISSSREPEKSEAYLSMSSSLTVTSGRRWMENRCCCDHETSRCGRCPPLFHSKWMVNLAKKPWKVIKLCSIWSTVSYQTESGQEYRRCVHSRDLGNFGGRVLQPTFLYL